MIRRRFRCTLVLLAAGILAAGTTAARAASLTPGLTATGTIVPGGGFDTWTFTANHHETYVVRVGQTSETGAFSPRIRVYGPGATLLGTATNSSVAEIADTAYATGTYTVQVDNSANTTATGGYILTLAESGHAPTTAPGDEGGPMTNGAMHVGTIGMGDLDVWTVTANTGESIVVRMGKTSGSLSPYLRIFSPAGAQLSYGYNASVAEVATTATATGTYVVVAADASTGGAGTGDYRLTLARAGAAVVVSGGDEGGPMTNGAMHVGTITMGDLDVWTVDANAGDPIVVRMGETSGSLSPYLRIFSPSGVQLTYAYNSAVAEVATTALATGTYLVVAADASTGGAGTGDYRMTLAKTGTPVTVSGADEGGPMTHGVMHTGTIDMGDLDLWTISANAGDAIVVRMGDTTGGLSPHLRLYGPSGPALANAYNASVAEVATIAPATGTYLVVADDASTGAAGTGGYRLTLAKTGAAVTVSPGDQGGPMTNGAMHTGTIDMGDLDLWTISANAGDAIVVRMGDTSGGLSPHLRLFSPSGVALGNAYNASVAEVATTAPATGTYLVVADDASTGAAGTGGYRLTLAKTGAAVTVSPGDQGGPMTNGAMHTGTIDMGDLDLWTVSANAGDAIIVRMGKTSGGLSPHVRIYSPSGLALGNGYNSAVAEVETTAPATGTYLVVADDASTGAAGTGDYRLTLAKTEAACVVTPGDQGGLMPSGYMNLGTIDMGDLDLWTVAANVGDAIIARMGKMSGSLSPYLRIYSPDGTQLEYAYNSAVAEVAVNAPATGTYLVVAGDASTGGAGTGDYRLTLALSGHPAVAAPDDEGGALDAQTISGTISMGDLDVWTVTVQPNDPIVVNMAESVGGSALSPYLRLYGPTGLPLASSYNSGSAQIAYIAQAPGTYMVVAADASTGGAGTGAYGLAPSPYADAGPLGSFAFRMAPAAPNPFVASTVIRFSTPAAGVARLELFDAQGRVVRTLVAGEVLAAGEHSAVWDGRDAAGSPARPGLYLARLEAAGRTHVEKVTLAR